jgi:hypothetical protein
MTDKVIATITMINEPTGETDGMTDVTIDVMIDVMTDVMDVTIDVIYARIIGMIDGMTAVSIDGMSGAMTIERTSAFAHIASHFSDSGWRHRLRATKYVPPLPHVAMSGSVGIGEFAREDTSGLEAVGKDLRLPGRFGSKGIGPWRMENGCSIQGIGLCLLLLLHHRPRLNPKSWCKRLLRQGGQKSCPLSLVRDIFGFLEIGLGTVTVTSGFLGIGKPIAPSGFGFQRIGRNTVRIGNIVQVSGSVGES